jgi:hypothetical protein
MVLVHLRGLTVGDFITQFEADRVIYKISKMQTMTDTILTINPAVSI